MRTIAVIPARGGSKRLKNKALQKIGGRTLLSHAILGVLETNRFNQVIVSSDATEILDEAKRHKGVNAQHRSPELASDDATTMDVIQDILTKSFDDSTIIALIQPTCPFRDSRDISSCLDMLKNGVYDSVISIMAAPFTPERLLGWSATDGLCAFELNSPLLQGQTREQSYARHYIPNGAVYVATAGHLRNCRNYFAGRVGGYLMAPDCSIDIDDECDLSYAQFLWQRQHS